MWRECLTKHVRYQLRYSLINILSLTIRASGAGLQLGSFRMLQQKHSKSH